MSFEVLKQKHAEIEELQRKRDQYTGMLEERAGDLPQDQQDTARKVIAGWADTQDRLAEEIATLIPEAAMEVSILLREQVSVRAGKTAELREILSGDAPLSNAFQKDLVQQNFDIGTTDEDGEKAIEAAEALSNAIEFDVAYRDFGAAILAILGNVEKDDVLQSDTASTADSVDQTTLSVENAHALITSDQATALKLIRGSKVNVATDLIELKETNPDLVLGFLRSLPPDARTEIFEPGLALGERSSLFLFDIGEVAAQIDQRFEQEVGGNPSSVNALSILAELVASAEDAVQESDAAALGHVLGVFACIGHGRLGEMIAHNYSKKGVARSGDVLHAEHVKDDVADFMNRYESEIKSLSVDIAQIDLTPSLEVAEGAETPVPHEKVKEIATETAMRAIEDASAAFQDVDID